MNCSFCFVETDQEMMERKVADPKQISALDSKYSVQALSLLAEVSGLERVIVFSVLFRKCMWIYSAVITHIIFISFLADCNTLISFTCIFKVAFEVRCSLLNFHMVVQES